MTWRERVRFYGAVLFALGALIYIDLAVTFVHVAVHGSPR